MPRSSMRMKSGYSRWLVEDGINFCLRCGGRLTARHVHGRPRPACPGCGFVLYLEPKVAAVVLASRDGRLVLVRRGIEPALGQWSFPSGYVDRGEAVEEAAIREVREETGLEVKLDRLVGLYSRSGSPVVLAVYSASVVGGTLAPGPEVQEVGLFHPDEMPPLPFPHDEQILQDWRAPSVPPGAGPFPVAGL